MLTFSTCAAKWNKLCQTLAGGYKARWGGHPEHNLYVTLKGRVDTPGDTKSPSLAIEEHPANKVCIIAKKSPHLSRD